MRSFSHQTLEEPRQSAERLGALEKGEPGQLRVCKSLTYCTYVIRRKSHPLGRFPTGCPPFDEAGAPSQTASLSQARNVPGRNRL